MKKDELFLKRVSAEILAELERVSKLMEEYRGFIDLYQAHMDKYQLRVKASFMADFYMGVEKIFEIVAEELNGGSPTGEAWHKRLLHTMTLEVTGVRPAVLSDELYRDLLKFLIEGLIGKRVDLVIKEAVKPRLQEKIFKEVVYV